MDKLKEKRNHVDLQDLKVWQEFTRDIKPIKSSQRVTEPVAPKKVHVKPQPMQVDPDVNLRSLQRSEVRVIEGTDFMDKKSLRMLHRGEMKIDARIDLHGMTEAQAFSELFKFLHSSYQNSHKLVLVITGKGTAENPSILKYKLPHWLKHEKIAPLIIRFCQASRSHGGEGATYVMLKTRREIT